jgi:uncharacterized protein
MQSNPFIHTLVVKIASRCNLNCTYCYMYNKGDTTYLQQPKVMSNDTIDNLITKIILHCQSHDLKVFTIVLHGGEPLLAGMEKIKYFVEKANEYSMKNNIEIKFTIQTNGLLLTEEWCKFLSKFKIRLSISLDGVKEINDKYRIDHAGNGSYDKILEAVNIANVHYTLQPPSILSVLDINNNPVEALNHIVAIGAKSVDFLLPASNYKDLPPKPTYGAFVSSLNPYGDWLSTLYNHLKTIPIEKRPIVKLFHNLIAKIMGAEILSDIIGDDENHVLVIETNGDIEPIDMLKICGNGFTKGNINIFTNTLDDAFSLTLAELYYNSHNILCEQCKECPILSLCGSGFIVHRYSEDNKFNNPTVYCKDYIKFITHIQSDIVNSLPSDFKHDDIVQAISFEEVISELNI